MGKSCVLSAVERQKIQQWIAAHGTPQQVALRCRIVLAATAGESNVAIAERLSVNRNTVIRWRQRFAEEGLDGLWDIAPGRGRKPKYQIDKIAAIVDATLQTKPAGMTHWSCRTMAKSQGVGKSTINNIWRAHKLQPHRTKTFKLSRDPKFLEKMTDVVGLYLNPPQQALVLCVDEKSQIQALDRTQPGLPMKKGRCGTMTHDYRRHGTTTLFAALSMLDGKVIGDFMPTSSSWLNLVERWFREITDKRIRRGSFGSVPELIAAIKEYLDTHNQNPRIFTWTASAERILAKVAKCKEALGTVH